MFKLPKFMPGNSSVSFSKTLKVDYSSICIVIVQSVVQWTFMFGLRP